MNICKGDIIVSLAGRDAQRYFFVMDVEGEYLLLADGRKRMLEHPKRKKRKHVRLAARENSEAAEKIRSGSGILNSELRRALAIYRREESSPNQGG